MITRRIFTVAIGASLSATLLRTQHAQAQAPRVRRDVMEMADDDPFFSKYGEAVRLMHELPESDGRNWRRQAEIHADFCHHGDLEFLHWHRHYINFFEQICGELIGDREFALPYWNWSKRSGRIPAPFFDLEALNVEYWNDPGIYSSPNWGPVDTTGRRGLDKTRGLLDDPQRGGSFTIQTIESIRKLPTIDLFRSRLEGSPHNDAHVVSGATLSGKRGHIGSGLSPLDPIFWLHHCMVDRVWAEWQSAGNMTPDPGNSYPGQFFEATGEAANADTASAMQISLLGYTYDVFEQVTALLAPPEPDVLDPISQDMFQTAFNTRAVRLLGAVTSDEPSSVTIETPIEVEVPELGAALEGNRIFRQSTLTNEADFGVEMNRILARLTDVTAPENGSDIIVNVFVNCPYLSPSTPYTDPHYAGTFSFFGRVRNEHHEHDFVIDITDPIRTLAREARISSDKIKIQLMPLPASAEGKSEATFQVGRAEIIAI